MNEKIKCLREKLRGLDIQGMIISNPVNVKYLTGIDGEGTLLITRKENYYITDARYIESVRATLTIDDEIIVSNYTDISEYDYENFFSFWENVGFEEEYITYATYKRYMQKYKANHLEETESIIEKQRLINSLYKILAFAGCTMLLVLSTSLIIPWANKNNLPIPAEYSTVISTVATLGVCLSGSLKYIVEAFNKMKKILAIKDENNIIEAARANALESNKAIEGE